MRNCRICGQTLPKSSILSLEKMPLTDDFIPVSAQDKKEFLADISIFQCSGCGLIQNPCDFDVGSYYWNYEYSSACSNFTKNFMDVFAATTIQAYEKVNQKRPQKILEIGSGDGEQLEAYSRLGMEVLGVEPSARLAEIADKRGVPTMVSLFDSDTPIGRMEFDICLASYTFDHVLDPVNYLQAANSALRENGILAIEVHDLRLTIERAEFCLFEHEHTIYMSESGLSNLIESCGFDVLSINPIESVAVRGNSLIVIARKMVEVDVDRSSLRGLEPSLQIDIQDEVYSLIARIDSWAEGIDSDIVGFGAGGRGVMTTSALKTNKIVALLDSNYETGKYLSPKRHLPVVGPESWRFYNDKTCLVFSFGYFDEIKTVLLQAGFASPKIVSLADFFEGGLYGPA